MDSQDYIEVSINIEDFSVERAEIVEAELSELPYNSFMIQENTGDEPTLKAYIQKELYDARYLRLALSGLAFNTTFSATMIPPQNWNMEWEREFTPIIVDREVLVKSSLHKDLPRCRFNITINPNMAFGTGHHYTTYMMISAMLKNEDRIKDKTVLDMGCGTGILSILSAKMKAAKVYSIDIDAVAERSAYDNVFLNKVSRRVETYCGDASLLQNGKYDVILANIHKNIILLDLKTYCKSLTDKGLLLTSGFFVSDEEDIIKEASEQGLKLKGKHQNEEWSCLEFIKQ